jgi:hypothetical protein
MKKQKSKKWGSREQRDAFRQELNGYGIKIQKHTNIPLKNQHKSQWPRARSGYAVDMYRAGYFGAMLMDASEWQNIHSWCKENLKQYSWNGNVFWFETDHDRSKFIQKFDARLLLPIDIGL